MSRFGSDPLGFFNEVYRSPAPWDVGAAQPALSSLFAEYPPAAPVLDLGCGSGDLAISLATSGLEVLGIDFVPAAIDLARQRASALPPEVAGRIDFQVADALKPSRLGRRFGSVVDSGFYHLFNPEECEALVGDLASVLDAGGRYYLLAFAVEFPVENVPRAISEAEVRATFTAERGWRIVEVREAEFLSRVATVPAIRACVERLPDAPAGR